MDYRQSRISKYYSSSFDRWNERLFDRLTDRNFRQSVRYVIFMDLNDSFIIITKNWRTFVYGPQVCAWLGLAHQYSSVNEIEELRYTELKQVDYGNKFFVVLTANGFVYMASRKFSDWRTDRQLKLISIESYRMISCGFEHILLLREDGKLFTMGDNSFGQLGRNNDSSSSFTYMIDTGLSHVKRIACGSDFSIAMTDNGVYSWGENECGQLGINHVYQQNTPKKIRFNRDTDGHQIVDIVAGDTYTMFLFDNGNVYECGNSNCFPYNKIFPERMQIHNIEAIACKKFENLAIFFKSNAESYVLLNFHEPTQYLGFKTFDDVFQYVKQNLHSFIPTFLNSPQLQQQSNRTNGSTVPTTSTSTAAAAATRGNISTNNNNDRLLRSICLNMRQLHLSGLAVSAIAKTPTTSISRNNDDHFNGLKTFDDVRRHIYQDVSQTPHSFIPSFLNNPQLQQSNPTNGSTVPTTSTATSTAATVTRKNISTNNNNDRSLCSICLDRERQIVFFPCCHLTSCEQCSIQMKNCPICRIDINTSLRVYLA
ncbi:uncharacterized protein LOC124496983 [Dermatophagoides farinae]|uniref:uncharacterized protein LOC124496983 n=1 Tax=Dermatophagoides farinae TaxID=6954 RepID=UPI003F5E4F52